MIYSRHVFTIFLTMFITFFGPSAIAQKEKTSRTLITNVNPF